MADAQLQVVIKARNDAKKAFNELGGQVKGLQGSTGFGGLNDKIGAFGDKFKSLTGVSLGFATAAGAASGAVMALGKFLADSVNETVAYATEIDNMSRLLGISTEDTSRLVQASDDLFISQEKLQAALQAATRQGIDVSIDGLKRLSEQYLALPPGVERSEFVLKTFGRSGAEMGKLMEQGADGIDAATAAIADNLIITKNSMGEIMNYKRSVDNLTDSWTGFKMEVGQAVIPQLDHLLRQLTSGKDAVELYQDQIYELNIQIQNLEKYGRQGGLSQQELEAQLAAARAEIERLTAEMYGVPDAAGSASGAFSELAGSIIPVTAYMQAYTEQLLFNQAAAGLDAEASLQLASAMGLVSPNTAFALDAVGRFKDQLASGQITLDQYISLVDDLNDAMGAITDVKASITIDFNYGGEGGGIGGAELLAGVDLNGNGIIGKARGGPVSSSTPYIVGEAGPELFVPNSSGNIVPNNKLTGNTVINFNYAPALSLSDRAEFETRVIPMMRRLISKAG